MNRSFKFTTCGVVLAAAASSLLGCSGAAQAPEADPALYGATAGALGTPLDSCSTAGSGNGYTAGNKRLVLTLGTTTGKTSQVILSATNGEVRVNNYACVSSTGATLKVADVSRVEVVGSSGSTADLFILDLLYGSFGTALTTGTTSAPSSTAGTGFSVDLAGGTGDKFMIRGTASADTITFGSDGTSHFADYTGDGKADVVIANTESLGASAAGGNDTLSGWGKVGTAAMTSPVSLATAAGTLVGTSTALTFFGGAGDDKLTGGGGADTLDGMEGNDTFYATQTTTSAAGPFANFDGNDTLTGGDGTDTVDYSARTVNTFLSIGDTRSGVVSSGAPCFGKPGDDGYYDGTGQLECDNVDGTVENLTGGSVTDMLIGSTSSNVINGGTGDDYIWGGPGGSCSSTVDVDVLNGGAGNDVFMALRATGSTSTDCRDTYNGGAGTDFVLYTWRTAIVTAGVNGAATSGEASEFDTIATDVEAIFGGTGADVLTAGAAGTALFGCGGNDKLFGGEGDDLGNGGAGDDLFVEKGTLAATYAGDFSGAVVSSLYVAADTSLPTAFVSGFLGCAAGTAGSTAPAATFIGLGADKMNGGTGVEDTIDYGSDAVTVGPYALTSSAGRTAALTITLCRATETTSTATATVCASGTAALDGETSEGDNVINITRVNGGTLGDTITGADTNDILYGFDGDDTLVGGENGNGEKNTITGGVGDDICLARGDDSVSTNNTPAAYTTCELTD